jgi:DNA (cytosine-5)-methyltransferase 1
MNKLSLFSGIGGDDLASEWAGIKTVCFVERDKYCQRVLKKHWPDVPIIGDVKDATKESIKEPIDIIAGGFPCQPFSSSGKQRGERDDRYLWPEMFRVIQEFKPSWVIAENVAGITRHMVFQRVLSDLEGVGFEAGAISIPACSIGAYHIRQRIFFCAYSSSKGLSGWKRKQLLEKTQKRQTEILYCERIRQGDNLPEPRLCGKLNGIPNGVDRLKGLGNAVVPQQIYPIYKAIVEIEAQGKIE